MVRRRWARRGFTLVEAIGAIVLLSVATPAMFWALRDAQIRRADPAALVTARWLATERLESVIADRHEPTRGYAYVLEANYPPETAVAGFAAFSRFVSIVETGPDLVSGGTGYRTVAVRVVYTAIAGSQRTFEVSTVVTDY